MLNLLLIFFSLLKDSYCHSAPSCTNKLDNITCAGFPRYYHFNHLPSVLPSSDDIFQFYSSRDRENILQPGINRICPSMPLPEYTNEFPMATVVAGNNITLQHPPRGHATQPSSPVWIYIYKERNVYNTSKELKMDKFKLIGEYNYSNCFGLDREISWANCTGNVHIPYNLKSGIYTFWWRWDLNSIPYYDCFDINIKELKKHKNKSN